MFIKQIPVDPLVFALHVAKNPDSKNLQWWFATTREGRNHGLRVVTSVEGDKIYHTSLSYGPTFGTDSTRRATDAECREILEWLLKPHDTWEEDNCGDDPNVRHFWRER